tara:strand:- start:2288 stop:3088 length:801 start_codon:yes stop_codon:yes gene_type:complete
MNNPPKYNDLITPSAPPQEYILSKSQKIDKLIREYEIDNLFSEKLDILSNYEIVLLIDDSGSMNTPLSNSKHNTRWDELKEVVNIVIKIATIFDDDGIDIDFLNRYNHTNIKDLDTVNYILTDKPYGLTPLNNSLLKIMSKYHNSTKPVLIVIATDGIPTDNNGIANVKNFTKTLKNRNADKFYISFLACSDQESDVGYLNKLDKKIKNIDTLDDYNSELQEVKKAQGRKFKYSFGDHIVRLLLGPICPELDKLDEKKIRKNCIIL